MTASYWKQWDSDDLNSWQGDFDEATIQKVNEDIENEENLKDQSKEQDDPFTGCISDYGISWKDFL